MIDLDEIVNVFNNNINLVVLGLCWIIILLFIYNLIQGHKIKKLSKKYKKFMGGNDKIGKDIEKVILENLDNMEQVNNIYKEIKDMLDELNNKLKFSYSKMGLIKYDAFDSMGGSLSFALAVLNENNNGFIINSIHSREGCYTYVKEIINGESAIILSEEEKEALNIAIEKELV